MTVARIAVLAALLVAFRADAIALSEISGIDLSLKTGLTGGTLKQGAKDDGTTQTAETSVSYGGLPIILALNLDISSGLTVQFEINVTADFGNSQIVGKGIGVGLQYHLLGGSKLVVSSVGNSTVYAHDDYNLSLVVKPTFMSYGATSKTGLQHIEGSSLELLAGLQYRFDIGDRTSMAIEFMNSIFAMPASSDRTTCSRYEFLLSYRFFL